MRVGQALWGHFTRNHEFCGLLNTLTVCAAMLKNQLKFDNIGFFSWSCKKMDTALCEMFILEINNFLNLGQYANFVSFRFHFHHSFHSLIHHFIFIILPLFHSFISFIYVFIIHFLHVHFSWFLPLNDQKSFSRVRISWIIYFRLRKTFIIQQNKQNHFGVPFTMIICTEDHFRDSAPRHVDDRTSLFQLTSVFEKKKSFPPPKGNGLSDVRH